MNRIIYVLLASLAVGTTYSQQLVSGIVSDETGPLPGTTVFVEREEALATLTDLSGYYELEVKEGDVLVFSFIGYQTQRKKVGEDLRIDVLLKEESEELSTVVIQVPYGTANRLTYTGSVGVIEGKAIERAQVSNVTKALQGTVAGLQSFSSSGQPGSEATIRIRGVGSVNASSTPLFVVDGVPYEGGLSSIAASDIESISVLKDATAATLYGSRAANGVVMITTKKGRNSKSADIEVAAKYGFSSRARSDYNQLNTNQYFELFWEAVRNGYMDKTGANEREAAAYATQNIVGMIGINPYGTDHPEPVGADGKLKPGLTPLWNDNWDEALSQNARYTDVNMRVSGGGEASNYYISGGFLNDQGYVIESGFKRFNFRSNLTLDARDWLQLGLNVSGAHSKQDYPKQDDSAISNVIGFARGMPSFYPVYERDRQTGGYLLDPLTGERILDYGSYRATSYAKYNLLGSMPYDKNEIRNDVATLRTFAKVDLLKNLEFKTSLNVDYRSQNRHDYTNPEFGPAALNGGSVTKRNDRTVSLTYNNILNYSYDLDDKNQIKLMVGQEYYQFDTSFIRGQRDQVIMNGFDEPNAASLLVLFDGKSDQQKMLSYFGNVQYAFDKRMYLSMSYRRDGSSRFYKRWGDFWSVGASWRLIDEKFMANVMDWGVNNLMLRASYGAQGNDNVELYAYQALYGIQNNLGESGLVTKRLPTPDLSWETNLNLNLGVDFGLWNNRLMGTIEFFERKSKDLLFYRDLSPSLGFSSLAENTGKIKNYGWEFTLEGTPLLTEDWRLHIGVNATTYKNKIIELPSEEVWSGNKRWVVGGSLYDFYLAEWGGVNVQNGAPQWYYTNEAGQRELTGNYSDVERKDYVYSGSSLPDISGGFQTELSYKNFELSANFTYVLGGKIYNRDKQSLMHLGQAGSTWSSDMLNRWTAEHTQTDIPRLTTSPESSWLNNSNRFLVDRSFLKLKNLTLAYHLPQQWMDKIGIKQSTVFVQAENLFTLTKEQGLDPEQTFDGSTYYRYPSMKTVSFGVNLKL